MKQLSRADAALLSDLRQADKKLGRLPEAMLEKDVFITEAALALSQLNCPEIGLVFCGGTSLCKAYRLIERMSEDVDFKLAVRVPDLSKNARRTLLKTFRIRAIDALKELGYELTDEHVVSRDSNSYISIKLPYATQYTAHAAIRPHVQIEFNARRRRVFKPCLALSRRTSRTN
jgi:predicted nucleotidyltransferase component of viral defense system